MTPDERKEIESRVLDMKHNDTFYAEFYMHKVIDSDNKSMIDAKAAADAKADKIYQRTGKYKEPDYTPENLIRLGATQTYKHVPYVKIQRAGARDNKSFPVSDEHKKQFPVEWGSFQEQNHEYFREERDLIQASEGGQQHDTPSSNWQGGVCYTPTKYSTTFG